MGRSAETNLARVMDLDRYEPRVFLPPNGGEFRRWFGRSAVVDDRGQPLVVYHGTDTDFETFDLAQVGRRTVGGKWSGPAAYFTSSLRLARSYATHERVLPVYLSIQNPYVFDAEGVSWRSVFPEVVDSARVHGHDGIIVRNVRDAARQWDADLVADTYVVFSADQVRLAGGLEPASGRTQVERLPVHVDQVSAALLPPSTSTPLTDTPAFRRWFRGSKVVDGKGAPLVVYHGTSEPWEEFKTGASPARNTKYQAMWGAHFTEDRHVAEGYASGEFKGAKTRRGPGHVHEVYLSIQNPLDLTSADPIPKESARLLPQKAQRDLRARIARTRHFGEVPEEGHLFLLELVLEAMQPTVARAWMESAGYDGVRYEAKYAQGGGRYKPDISWIAFHPAQIKSVNNVGTFDPADPRIERMLTPPAKTSGRGLRTAVEKGEWPRWATNPTGWGVGPHLREVAPGLWVGGQAAVLERPHRSTIWDTILNLRSEPLDRSETRGGHRSVYTEGYAAAREVLHIPVEDGEPIPDAVLERVLLAWRERSGPMLVHCHWGVSRSASAACAILIADLGLPEEEAIQRVSTPGARNYPRAETLYSAVEWGARQAVDSKREYASLMERMRISPKTCPDGYYHATTYKSVGSIAVNGLQPRQDDGLWTSRVLTRHSRGKVFLAKGPDAAMKWLFLTSCVVKTKYPQGGPEEHVPVLLRVDLPPGVKPRVDPKGKTAAPCSFYIQETIPPERIRWWNGTAWVPLAEWGAVPVSNGVNQRNRIIGAFVEGGFKPPYQHASGYADDPPRDFSVWDRVERLPVRQPSAPPLFHTTGYDAMNSIAEHGLLPRQGRGVFNHGGYADHSQGRVFLAGDPDAARTWFNKVGDMLEYNASDFEELDDAVIQERTPVMLRVDGKWRAQAKVDPLGDRDVSGSFYVEGEIPPEDVAFWSPSRRTWRPVTEWGDPSPRPAMLRGSVEDGIYMKSASDPGGFKPIQNGQFGSEWKEPPKPHRPKQLAVVWRGRLEDTVRELIRGMDPDPDRVESRFDAWYPSPALHADNTLNFDFLSLRARLSGFPGGVVVKGYDPDYTRK